MDPDATGPDAPSTPRRGRTGRVLVVLSIALAALAVAVALRSGSGDPSDGGDRPDVAGAVPRPCPAHDGPTEPVVEGRAEVGDPLPQVTMPTVDGCTVSLADYAGTPLVIAFGASWCQPCHVEWPNLVAELDDNPGRFAVVAVAFREALTSDTRDFLTEVGAPWQAIDDRDGKVAQAFGVRTVPTTFYVDGDGIIRDRLFVGDRKSVHDALNAQFGPPPPG